MTGVKPIISWSTMLTFHVTFGTLAGTRPYTSFSKHLDDFRTALVPPHLRGGYFGAVVQCERVREIRIWIGLRFVVVGVIRGVLVAAWTGTQGLDAQLIHHVLVVLLGGEVDRRRRGSLRCLLRHCREGRSSKGESKAETNEARGPLQT